MRIVRGLESYPPDAPPAAVALGVFDGIHLAHRAILATALGRARALGVEAVACTFDPHPMDVLQPDRAPLPLTTMDERLELIGRTGIGVTVVLDFTPKLAAMEPEAFVKEIVLGRLHAREVIVGFNHTFGRGARGDAQLLRDLAGELGFRAHVVPPLLVDGTPASSSAIRAALQAGEVERATRYLGRPYATSGTVVAGAGRGRTLGFPTANVALDRPLLVGSGVYACYAVLTEGRRAAVVNVGVRPTFGERVLTVEAHLLDFTGDLYDRRMKLEWVGRLRGERRFDGVEALRAQIARDVADARRCL